MRITRYIFISYTIINCHFSLCQQPILLSGFPRLIDSTRQSGQNAGIPICSDLFRNGQKEIITVATDVLNITNFPSAIHVIKNDGSELQAFPKLYTQIIFDIAVGDLDGDGYLDIVIREQDSLDVINRFGIHIQGFPIYYPTIFPIGFLPSANFLNLYDLDGDGQLEIITGQYGKIAVFDHMGNFKSGWPKNIVGRVHDNPAIGDIDGDGKAEIIATSFKEIPNSPHFDSTSICIYKYDGSIYSGNWPIYYDSSYTTLGSSPSLYIKKSGTDTTFILNIAYNGVNPSNSVSRFTKYDINGNILQRYYYPQYYSGGTFALGDLNRDNKIDILGGYLGPDITLYNDHFEKYSGWPQNGNNRGWVTSIIGKLTTNNELNILTPAWYANNGTGYVFSYDYLGNALNWSGLKTKGIVSGITVADLFGDGSVDIITSDIQTEDTYFLNAWKIPGISFSYDDFQWPMFCHDRYKTNQYGFVPPDEPIDIKKISNNIPETFSVLQNYPNPFNPSTHINFSIPKKSLIKIIIYDVMGKKADELVNYGLEPGTYSVDWNASGFASGVYFYRLVTVDFTDTKKMVLIK